MDAGHRDWRLQSGKADSIFPMSQTMENPPKRGTIAASRITGLFCLFFLIAFGLGYPVLNRYDPRQTAGLSDVRVYAAMVSGAASVDAGHLRFRVLVPWVARPFYRLAVGRSGSWDPVMFGLLVADSLFVSATALIIVFLGSRQLGGFTVSLVASLLYLVNFAVPNLRLAGLVDAGEGFFLLLLLWSLAELRLWLLPFVAVLGALTKETFVPLSIVFMVAWWLAVCKTLDSRARSASWIVASSVASFAATAGLQAWIRGGFVSPIEFAAGLHGNHEYAGHFLSTLSDRNFWYVFVWLLPMAIPNLRRLPTSWLVATGAATAAVVVLDAYYGGAPGTVGRALFSLAGPILALSAALLLVGRADAAQVFEKPAGQ
jgi:hypothetical protein